ncbi:PRP38 family protein, partial [Cardiosporidium cionae]
MQQVASSSIPYYAAPNGNVFPPVSHGAAPGTAANLSTVPGMAGSGMYYPAAPAANVIENDTDDIEDVQRCHLHSKPQLNCKFCRKYKSAVHQMGRIAQAQQAQRGTTEERRNLVEMTDSVTYNVNNLLRGNILSSEYYKSLFSLKTFNEVVDEIYQYTEHAEPYVTGSSRAPSTLFCCLYKFFTMRLSEKQVFVFSFCLFHQSLLRPYSSQMSTLLDHVDSPYIRC